MKKKILEIWSSRSPAERTMAAGLAIVIGTLLCLWFIHVAGQQRDRLKLSVSALKSQSAAMEQQASAGCSQHQRARYPLQSKIFAEPCKA
jgi:type II secretory pathway component PulM